MEAWNLGTLEPRDTRVVPAGNPTDWKGGMQRKQHTMPIRNEPSSDVIEILDSTLRHGFAQIPRQVLRATGLSRNAKCLYALLLDYAWQEGSCFPGQPRLAHDLGVSDRTIRTDLDELREYGLVSWRRRGLSLTNVYQILSIADNPRLGPQSMRDAEWKHSSDVERKEVSAPDRTRISDYRETADVDSEQHHSVGAVNKAESQRSTPRAHLMLNARSNQRAAAIRAMSEHITATVFPDSDPLIAAIVGFGLSRGVALRLIHRHPTSYIQSKLDQVQFLLKQRPSAVAKNPAGYLRCAIEDDYAAPPGYKSPAQREAEEHERSERRRAIEEHEQEERQRREITALKAQKAAKSALERRYSSKPLPGTTLTTTTAWRAAKEMLKGELSSAEFHGFVALAVLARVEDGIAYIATVNEFAARYLTTRLGSAIQGAIATVLGQAIKLRVSADINPTMNRPMDDIEVHHSRSRNGAIVNPDKTEQ